MIWMETWPYFGAIVLGITMTIIRDNIQIYRRLTMQIVYTQQQQQQQQTTLLYTQQR